MAISKIKPEHAKKYVAFGNGTKVLGERDDIDELAIIAQQSNSRKLIDLFETLPSLEDLQKAKTDKQLKPAAKESATPAVTAPAPVEKDK